MLGDQQLTIRSANPGVRIDGIWHPGGYEERPIRGVIQPLTEREAERVPEGWRTKAKWKLYTKTKLKAVTVETPSEGDRVVWQDLDLLVLATRDYSATPKGMRLRHHKYVLIEPEQEET